MTSPSSRWPKSGRRSWRGETLTGTRGGLRAVHRRIGVAQELVGVGGVARVERDADRRADVELGAGDRERLGERLEQVLGDAAGVLLGLLAVEIAEQEQELVAALAGE